MKTSKYTLVSFLLIGMSMMVQSCSKNADPAFFVNIERDFNVENTLNPFATHIFELRNIPTNLEQNLELFGLPKENITNANPADAVLTTASGFMDWSLVTFVEIYAVSRIDPQNRKQIFNIRSRDTSSKNELKMFNTFAEISDLMGEGVIDLEVRLQTITSVPGNFRAKLFFNYAVYDEI